MKNKTEILILAAVAGLMLLLIFVLPLFSFPGYSVARNSILELGAQFSPNAWIINVAIALFSAASVIAGWKYFEGFILHRIMLVLFGISLMLLAVFNHAPVNTAIRYNITESGLNSYFAASAVLSFTTLTIATGFILERQRERMMAVVSGVMVLILSILSSESVQLAGIWQRLMFITASAWMIINFNSRTNQ